MLLKNPAGTVSYMYLQAWMYIGFQLFTEIDQIYETNSSDKHIELAHFLIKTFR